MWSRLTISSYVAATLSLFSMVEVTMIVHIQNASMVPFPFKCRGDEVLHVLALCRKAAMY